MPMRVAEICIQYRKYLQEDVVWLLLTQILMALRECHHGQSGRQDSKAAVAILHRDLKPDNGKAPHQGGSSKDNI